jgi:chorismate mutase
VNPVLRHQLNHLDRALLALLDERARLVAGAASRAATHAAVDDLLRRHEGPVDSRSIRAFFESVDAACESFRPRGAPEERP